MRKYLSIFLAFAHLWVLPVILSSDAQAQRRPGKGRMYVNLNNGSASSLIDWSLQPGETRLIIQGNGQSNNVGTNSGGCRNCTSSFPGDVRALTAPATDKVEVGVETPATELGNYFREWLGAGHRIYIHSSGISGQDWENLRDGGSTQLNWDNYVGRFDTTISYDPTAICLFNYFNHGESDSWDRCNSGVDDGCVNEYRTYIRDFQADSETYCKNETGQTRDVPAIITQVASWHSKSRTGVPLECHGPNVALEQVAEARSNPKVILSNGTVHMGSTAVWCYSNDGVHYGDNGANGTRCHTLLGDYMARAARYTFDPDDAIPGGFKPMWINTADAAGTTLTVKYNVPCDNADNCSGNKIVLDTTLIAAAHNAGEQNHYGFVLYDPHPNPASIVSVTLGAPPNDDTFTIVTDKAIRTGSYIEVALDYYCGAYPGNGDRASNKVGARANFRDTSSDVSYNLAVQENLYNYPVQERFAISGGVAPPASVATVIDDMPVVWGYKVRDPGDNTEFPGVDCNASKDWESFVAGGSTMNYGNGTWTCNNSTGSLGSSVISLTSVGEAIITSGASAGWETSDQSGDFAKDDDDDLWLRLVIDTQRGGVIQWPLWYGLTDSNNRWYLQFNTAGSMTMIIGTSGGNYTTVSGNDMPASSTLGVIDIFIDDQGMNDNSNVWFCVNGQECDLNISTVDMGSIGCKTETDCGTTNPAALDMAIWGAFNQSRPRTGNAIIAVIGARGPAAWRAFDHGKANARAWADMQ